MSAADADDGALPRRFNHGFQSDALCRGVADFTVCHVRGDLSRVTHPVSLVTE